MDELSKIHSANKLGFRTRKTALRVRRYNFRGRITASRNGQTRRLFRVPAQAGPEPATLRECSGDGTDLILCTHSLAMFVLTQITRELPYLALELRINKMLNTAKCLKWNAFGSVWLQQEIHRSRFRSHIGVTFWKRFWNFCFATISFLNTFKVYFKPVNIWSSEYNFRILFLAVKRRFPTKSVNIISIWYREIYTHIACDFSEKGNKIPPGEPFIFIIHSVTIQGKT